LHRCVASLVEQSRPPDRIVVVDNNSQDRSLESLAAYSSRIQILKMERNTGFAAANNAALKALCECNWVALLNPDAFAESRWLAELLGAAAANPVFSCFASRMLCSDDPTKLDGAGDAYHFTGWPARRGNGRAATERYLQLEEVFSACAGAALYRRDAIMTVGGFDQTYFCYVEDVDLGFRLRLRGYRCLYVPTAVVRHVGSGTTGKHSDVSLYYGHRNVVWTFFKDMPLALLALFLLPHCLMNIAAILKFSMRGQGNILLRAKLDGVRGLRRVLQERRRVQGARTGSIWQIARVLSFGRPRS
jgi:GT2 family glycosyltransferase